MAKEKKEAVPMMEEMKETVTEALTTPKTEVMVIREIDLEQPTEAILREIAVEKDLFVLHQAMAHEGNKGKRSTVMSAMEQRGLQLRRHGDGSEGPDFDLPGYKTKTLDHTPLFDTMNRMEQPKKNATHDQGEGAISQQRISPVERIHGELERKEASRRMNTPAELFELQERTSNGSLVFRWGHMMKAQQEIKDADGKVRVKWRPSLIFLKACPRCGRDNRPESGAQGRCYNCELDLVPYARAEIQQNPSKYPGIQLDSPTA